MARQLDNWIDHSGVPDPALLAYLLEQQPRPFPLDWYRANPRLATDRLMKFDQKPEFTPCYDEGDF
jgi:hypothetical protein